MEFERDYGRHYRIIERESEGEKKSEEGGKSAL